MNSLKITNTPRAVLFMSELQDKSGGKIPEMTPVPLLEYQLLKTNNDKSDVLTFKCPLNLFPRKLFDEIFMRDSRSGRIEVELYTNYVDPNIETYIKDKSTGKYKYNNDLIDILKNDNNLRFYGLVNLPKIRKDLKRNEITFQAFDLSQYLKSMIVRARFEDMTCVNLVKHITEYFKITDIVKLAPSVDKETKIGDKGTQTDCVYICKNKTVWNILKDCAERLGESIRVHNREIRIGRFDIEVNNFTYIYGRNEKDDYEPNDIRYDEKGCYINNIEFKMNPALTDKNIRVEVRNYKQDMKEYEVGIAQVLTEDTIEEFKKQNNASSQQKQQNTMRKVRTFIYYQHNYEGNLQELAKKILKNIVYKRWMFSFSTVGNPYIQPDDRVTIKNFFGNSKFGKIKWYVSKISESYTLRKGYESKIELEGNILGEDLGYKTESFYKFYKREEFKEFTGKGARKKLGNTKPMNKNVLCVLPQGLSSIIKGDTPLSEAIYKIAVHYKNSYEGRNHCAYFVSKVLRAAGVDVYDATVDGLYTKLVQYGFKHVAVRDIQKGDIVMNVGTSASLEHTNLARGIIEHTGIAISNKYALHVSTSAGYRIATGQISGVFRSDQVYGSDEHKGFKALRPPNKTWGDLCGE